MHGKPKLIINARGSFLKSAAGKVREIHAIGLSIEEQWKMGNTETGTMRGAIATTLHFTPGKQMMAECGGDISKLELSDFNIQIGHANLGAANMPGMVKYWRLLALIMHPGIDIIFNADI